MKVGAVYSLFNSEELVEGSIKSIRSSVDFIAIVYQTKSNFGNSYQLGKSVAKDLLSRGLVDKILPFEPFVFHQDIKMSGVFNTIKKRNIAQRLARQNGCTHFLSLDCDEFYLTEQLDNAIKIVKEGDYDSSFCQMETYYKYPECQLVPKWEGYYVPFLYKIRDNIEHTFFDDWDKELFVDNCRRQEVGKKYVFKRDELEMHHFSYLRKDIRNKYENTEYSTLLNPDWINQMEESYNNFDIEKDSSVSILKSDGIEPSKFKIVSNQFNIKI